MTGPNWLRPVTVVYGYNVSGAGYYRICCSRWSNTICEVGKALSCHAKQWPTKTNKAVAIPKKKRERYELDSQMQERLERIRKFDKVIIATVIHVMASLKITGITIQSRKWEDADGHVNQHDVEAYASTTEHG
ncbi:hypothetical protein CPB84DRAFT_1744480 [Gymnopilus junonius]|uniref:Uncharacterized protein n=1 Tax=Gymnopilus junonius TaxID=109634 RepID=A0A9P5NWS0_GYMJU|nr:hypothetical protein CPB84DRAFT_1744480 [Gymnopilus junonius]